MMQTYVSQIVSQIVSYVIDIFLSFSIAIMFTFGSDFYTNGGMFVEI